MFLGFWSKRLDSRELQVTKGQKLDVAGPTCVCIYSLMLSSLVKAAENSRLAQDWTPKHLSLGTEECAGAIGRGEELTKNAPEREIVQPGAIRSLTICQENV